MTFGAWVAAIASRRRLMGRVVIFTLVVAALVVLLRPPVYRAHTSFVTAGSSGELIASALSSGTGIDVSSSQSGVGTVREPMPPPEFYVQLIQSEELRRRLLNSRFLDPRGDGPGDSAALLQILRPRTEDPRRAEEIGLRKLAKSIIPNVNGESNLVEVRVKSQWPEIASAVANRTVALVHMFSTEQRTARSTARRGFIESRVAAARIELQQADERTRLFHERNRQWRNSPQLVSDERRLRRQSDAASGLFVALQRQYESARLDEANQEPVITVVDAAVPPRRAQWPRYRALLANAIVVACILAVAIAGARAFVADWRRPRRGAEVAARPDAPRSFAARVVFPMFAWGLVFHSLIITVLFGWLGLPENTVRTIAAWKEAGLAILLIAIIIRAATGHGQKAPIAWPDIWIGGLMTTAVLFLLTENLWLGFDLPPGAGFLGIRDSVYFMFAYFIGRAMPELASDDRAMRTLFVLIVVTCGIGILERLLVTPEMLVGLGVASYFQDFLGVSAFTVGNDFGLPLNYWTMIGGDLFRRAGSVYLSGQGFAVPFILFFPLATAWVFLRPKRSRGLITAFAVVSTGLVLTLTRMTILVALIQLVLFMSLIRRPEWAVAGVALASVIFAGAFVSIPGFPTFVWHTLSWQEGSSISHVNDWVKGLTVFAENPWGSGLGTTDQTAIRVGLAPLTGDNLYFKYAVEMGVAGLGFLILILGALGGVGMRLYRSSATLTQQRMGITLVLAVAGIGINGATAVVFNSITLGWLFFWLAGAAVTVAARLQHGVSPSTARGLVATN